jgi:hypothetical protein
VLTRVVLSRDARQTKSRSLRGSRVVRGVSQLFGTEFQVLPPVHLGHELLRDARRGEPALVACDAMRRQGKRVSFVVIVVGSSPEEQSRP